MCQTFYLNNHYYHQDAAAATDEMQTNGVFRDTHHYYHVVLAVDTTQATEANRIKIYVDGVEQTFSTANYPAQNVDTDVNSAVSHRIGASISPSAFLNGYISKVDFIDGLALTPSSFGHESTDTGKWVPSNTSGLTFGTNGFSLDFNDDRASTPDTTTTIYDQSGNSNNWTGNSLVAGSFTSDTPVDNFATFNATDAGSGTLSNGNKSSASTTDRTASVFVNSGKWAWKVTAAATGSFGVVTNGLTGTESVASDNSGEVIEFELDIDSLTLKKRVDGGSLENVDLSLTAGTKYIPLFKAACAVDFGADSFTPTDSSFKPLSSANLPVPTILKPQEHATGALATGANIESSIAALRSAWSTNYVDIYKDRDTSEAWKWRFGHDASNEYDVSTTATYSSVTALSGSEDHIGYTLRVDSVNCFAGSATVSGSDVVVTHNAGNARAMIFIFPRSNGEVFVYHPDATSGELLYLTGTNADFASTAITTITANAFTLDQSVIGNDTYDYLVLVEGDVYDLSAHVDNSSADGAMIPSDGLFAYLEKIVSTTGDWNILDVLRSTFNPTNHVLETNTPDTETNTPDFDFVSNGMKKRTSQSGTRISLGIKKDGGQLSA